MNKKFFIALNSFIIIFIFMISVIAFSYHIPFKYSSDIYSITADSSIKHFFINGQDIRAKYGIFQCEENHNGLWKVETVKKYVNPVGKDTLLTYSSLYLFDVYKTFIFRSDGFTANISKCYLHSGFDQNNQIIFDAKNIGFVFNESSFTFLEKGFNVIVTILWSNVPIKIQLPISSLTELQFNFNSQSDRDIAYHSKGLIESALFDVRIF